jgi:uncharacterized protein (TIGR03083 family)
MLISPRYDGPPIISISGAPSDQLAPVVRQRRRLAALLADLPDADWATPSRCAGWTVHDVVAHLDSVDGFWAASVNAGLAGAPTRVLRGFDPAATPPLLVAPMRALTPAAMLAKLVASSEAFLGVLAGLDDDGWATPAESPAGHVPIRMLAAHALWDCWVHERDIALPLGLEPVIVADEVAASLRYVAALSPALAMGFGNVIAEVLAVEATDPAMAFVLDVGESVAVHDDVAPDDAPCLRGDGVALLEALSLRAPLPPSAPVAWQNLLEGLATAFDVEPQRA